MASWNFVETIKLIITQISWKGNYFLRGIFLAKLVSCWIKIYIRETNQIIVQLNIRHEPSLHNIQLLNSYNLDTNHNSQKAWSPFWTDFGLVSRQFVVLGLGADPVPTREKRARGTFINKFKKCRAVGVWEKQKPRNLMGQNEKSHSKLCCMLLQIHFVCSRQMKFAFRCCSLARSLLLFLWVIFM